jgi:hypothetical protein
MGGMAISLSKSYSYVTFIKGFAWEVSRKEGEAEIAKIAGKEALPWVEPQRNGRNEGFVLKVKPGG